MLWTVRADYNERVDNTDRVEDSLTDHLGGFYCNRCLSEEFLVLNASQVGQITRPLRSLIPYRHGKMICTRCRGDRDCIAYGHEPALAGSVEPVRPADR
jgi:hypothetical protein